MPTDEPNSDGLTTIGRDNFFMILFILIVNIVIYKIVNSPLATPEGHVKVWSKCLRYYGEVEFSRKMTPGRISLIPVFGRKHNPASGSVFFCDEKFFP